MKAIFYLILGTIFGYVLIASQVVSWYRIQEMFLFDNFHMYGVIGTAIAVGASSMFVLKSGKIQSLLKERTIIVEKPLSTGTYAGGFLFGLGWSITGSCPGPIYALIGNGNFIYVVVLLSALLGVLAFGKIQNYSVQRRDKEPN